MDLEADDRRSPWSRWLLAAAVVVAAGIASTGVAMFVGSGASDAVVFIPLDALPRGVTPVDLAGRGGIVVRDGESVIVLSPRSPRSEDVLVWCPSSHAIIGATSGSFYDPTGTRTSGPTPRSLDLVASTVDDATGTLVVDTSDVVRRDIDGDPLPATAGSTLDGPRYSREWAAAFLDGASCPAPPF